ncbi:unnamed protein product [Parnassius apollo]|uniref:(apollo) hypothetical protein n=1 Tax=Parnassius apollo TaxID=110799 RepID=A0A8S3X6M1_PARAO|nr:unnamed protein product [Parnassius apollo]
MTNVQSDEAKSCKIIEKLSRLNIIYADFTNPDNDLPKTICFSCIENLNKAFEFVVGVDRAQSVLTNIVNNEIKTEHCSSEDYQQNDIVDSKSDSSIDIKEELVSQSYDCSYQSVDSENCKNVCTSNVNNNELSSDILPLKYIKSTWSDYLWTCAYCETQFATVEELKVHSMQYHQCCNAFRCKDCKIRTLHLNKFVMHIKWHRKYLKLLCYICNKEFMFQHQLHSHIKKVHGPKTEHFCLGCNAEFQHLDDLNKHTHTFYKDRRVRNIPDSLKSVNSLTCIICKKTFKSIGTLNTHLLIHTERKRENTCEKCGKCFYSKQALASHMLIHDNVRPYQCEICKWSFKTSKQLKSHVGSHNAERPHTCDQCGRSFRLLRQLNSHKIIHTDILPYVCSYCNKKFRFKSILNQHIRQHTGVKPYSCDKCRRDFANWPNYNKHMKRRHGLDMAKKKHTPEGVFPINPSTGEIIKHLETNEMLEWKNKILQNKGKGRPISLCSVNTDTTASVNIEKNDIKRE